MAKIKSKLLCKGLRLTMHDEGPWLHFSCKDGGGASINLSLICGPITKKCLLGWADDRLRSAHRRAAKGKKK
jgi:hypothetical protein